MDFIKKALHHIRGLVVTICLGCLFGIVGVASDADHLLPTLRKGLAPTLVNLATYGSREMHLPLVVFGWCFSCVVLALLVGLLVVEICE